MLAKALLAYDRRIGDGDVDQRVEIDGRTWAKWMEFARVDVVRAERQREQQAAAAVPR